MIRVDDSSLIDGITNGIYQGSHTPLIAFLWDYPSRMKPPVRQVWLGAESVIEGVKTNENRKRTQPPVASEGFMNAVGLAFLVQQPFERLRLLERMLPKVMT